MEIIVLPKAAVSRSHIHLGSRAFYASLFVMLILGLLVAYGSYQLGAQAQRAAQQEWRVQVKALTQNWQAVMKRRQSALAKVAARAEEGLKALARRVGRLQAKVARLTALGQRLVERAGLENGEFDFTPPSSRGGPKESFVSESVSLNHLLTAMEQLQQTIAHRRRQLSLLETVLMERDRWPAAFSAIRPLHGGWISSDYGYRPDPFTGQREFHPGVDFAAEAGTKILAIADGIVTWTGWNGGYGKMVEIAHGNGYISRYGHSQKILVEVGERVTQGEPIALVGSTGHSTGPHVHLEILYQGRKVDPLRFINGAHKIARED